MTSYILLVGDINIPFGAFQIPLQFRELFHPQKITQIVCTGNVTSPKIVDYLKGISTDILAARGPCDETTYPEYDTKEAAGISVGVISGHQIVPLGDTASLADYAAMMECDVLVAGSSPTPVVTMAGDRLIIRPGSLTGSILPNDPSFSPDKTLSREQHDEPKKKEAAAPKAEKAAAPAATTAAAAATAEDKKDVPKIKDAPAEDKDAAAAAEGSAPEKDADPKKPDTPKVPEAPEDSKEPEHDEDIAAETISPLVPSLTAPSSVSTTAPNESSPERPAPAPDAAGDAVPAVPADEKPTQGPRKKLAEYPKVPTPGSPSFCLLSLSRATTEVVVYTYVLKDGSVAVTSNKYSIPKRFKEEPKPVLQQVPAATPYSMQPAYGQQMPGQAPGQPPYQMQEQPVGAYNPYGAPVQDQQAQAQAYGAPAQYSYGQQGANPYGASGTNSYGNSPRGNVYSQSSTPYRAPTPNPYGAPVSSQYGDAAANPYGAPASNPYGAPAGNPYETSQFASAPGPASTGGFVASNPYGATSNDSRPYGAPQDASNPYEAAQQGYNSYGKGY